MAKAPTPLTFATAKLGQTYTSADGKTYKKIQSPYDPSGKAMLPLLMEPGNAQSGQTSAGATPAQAHRDPIPALMPAQAINHDASLADTHLADLRQRQAVADANNAQIDAFHAELDTAPPPSNAPIPVPTIAPQPTPKVIEANVLPTAAIKDIGTGLFYAPSEIESGAKQAVKNLVGFSDHIGDMIEEHVPTTMYYSGFDHIGQPGNQLSVQLDTAANFAKHGVTDGRPSAAINNILPDSNLDHPASVTGGLIQGAAQFATGYAAGGALLKGWKAAAGTGQVVKAMAQGALADFGAFDAHQQRLSDLLKAHAPDAIKPVFDYLASDPRDGEVEGRLKNAMEGLGLGVATHGVISAARYLRSARLAQRAAAIAADAEGLQGTIDAPHIQVEAEAKKFHDDLQADVGNVGGKGFTITRKFPLTAQSVAATADAGEMGPNTIGLNYAKISDETDLQAASVQFYDAFHPEIMNAKRSPQSIDKQIDDAFGVDVSKMLGEWQPGTAMASHELTALRFAQAGAMKDFLAHARDIAGGDSSLAKQAAFLQTGGVLDAMTRAVEGGKAEAARTLRTLRETVPSMVGDQHNSKDVIEFYRKVDALVAGAGGREMVERAAKAFLTVAQRNPLGTSKFLRFIQGYGKFSDASKEHLSVFMTNGLLSIPGNVANIVGNASAMVWEPMMRQLAPHLSDMVGVESHIAPGEHIAMKAGMKAAFGDILRLSEHINAGTDWKAHLGLMNLDKAKSNTKGFASMMREEVRTAKDEIGPGMEQGPETDTALGRVTRLVWSAVKIPGHLNGLMDDFTKIISGRAELHAQAYRQAIKDADTGLITMDQVGHQMQKYIEDPSADMLEKVIAAQKELSWTRESDTRAGDFTKAVGGLRSFGDSIPIPFPLGTSILPFVRTPANVFSYGMRNSIFAPLSFRWAQEMVSPDGATRQLALTKYAAGSLASLWVMDHVANGDITGGGPADPAQKQAMMRIDPDTHATLWQPYSIRVGDHWVDYSRLDPAATVMSIAADTSESWLGNDWTDARAQTAFESFATSAMGIGSAFLNKSTMQGMSQLMDAIASAKQGNPAKPAAFFEKRAVAMVLFSSVLGSARRSSDPYMREVTDMTSVFKNQVPGLSKDLPASFDLWGRHRTYESGMGSIYDFMVPARAHAIGGEPADREMLRLGFAKQMPSKSITVGGQSVNLRNYPMIYNEILTRGGPPALAEINDLVTGVSPNSGNYESLKDGSDPHEPGSKARFLKGRLDYHFHQATESVKRDFADELQQLAVEQSSRRSEARTGP